jgi:hypothetical protein
MMHVVHRFVHRFVHGPPFGSALSVDLLQSGDAESVGDLLNSLFVVECLDLAFQFL